MKILKTLLILSVIIVIPAKAQVPSVRDFIKEGLSHEGGATSGGGDTEGIMARSIVTTVLNSIREAGNHIYTSDTLANLEKISSQLKVIMTDEEIRIPVGEVIQNSSAFSVKQDKKIYMFIQRSKWNAEKSQDWREDLVHHELMILAGLETTGDYAITDKHKKFRENYWKYITTTNNVCSIQLFDKNPFSPNALGSHLGSDSASINFTGAKGAMGILKKDKESAIIWRGVIDNLGYFRMQIELASYHKNSDWPNLGKTRILEEERLYSDPYNANKELSPVHKGKRFLTVVNCTRF